MKLRPSYVVAWERKGFAVPGWWLFLNLRMGWPWLANRLYAWRYGTWAPSLMDLLESETLHGLNATAAADWFLP